MKNHNVIVYSTTTCPYCVYAKNYFTDNNISFKDINVSTDHKGAEEMINKSGQRGVPVIDIDGHIIVGFQPELFDKILNQ